MSIEAMKQALEALKSCSGVPHWPALQPAITALHAAIEQAEKQEPVAWMYDFLNPDNRDEVIRDWTTQDYAEIEREKGFNVRPLYTAPRQWIGLTDDERRNIREWQEIQGELGPVWAPMMLYLYLAIEAKLKEKNT